MSVTVAEETVRRCPAGDINVRPVGAVKTAVGGTGVAAAVLEGAPSLLTGERVGVRVGEGVGVLLADAIRSDEKDMALRGRWMSQESAVRPTPRPRSVPDLSTSSELKAQRSRPNTVDSAGEMTSTFVSAVTAAAAAVDSGGGGESLATPTVPNTPVVTSAAQSWAVQVSP